MSAAILSGAAGFATVGLTGTAGAGATVTGMQVETAVGSTILWIGADLAVTLTGSFDVTQFQRPAAASPSFRPTAPRWRRPERP